MKSISPEKAPNKIIALLRQMAAEKRETQRQMRESFKTDPDVQRIVEELDTYNAKRKPQAV